MLKTEGKEFSCSGVICFIIIMSAIFGTTFWYSNSTESNESSDSSEDTTDSNQDYSEGVNETQINARKMLSRCEGITDWSSNGIDLAVDTDMYEGLYSITATIDDTEYIRYTKAFDISGYTSIKFYAKENVAEQISTLKLKIYTDINNYGTWDFTVDEDDGWTLCSETLASPDAEVGTLDLSDVTYIEWVADTVTSSLNIDYVYCEITDVSTLFSCMVKKGIFPYPDICVLGIDPDNTTSYFKGQYVLVQDDSSNDVHYGKIVDIKVNERGVTYAYSVAFTNELLKMSYVHTFATDTSSEKFEYILDNKASFCYKSSVLAEALDYSYEQDDNIRNIINLFRFLERIVIYCAPDGATTTKAYNGLTATGENWDQDDNDVVLLDYSNPTLEIYGAEVEGSRASSILQSYTVAADEGAYGEQRIIKWRDIKIMEAATALQLATNLYNIFSAETQFITVHVTGKGYLQPGQTVVYAHSGYSISSTTAMILYYEYDAYNDVYRKMILTDNIATIQEFNSYGASLKSLEQTEAMIYDTYDICAAETATVSTNLATHAALTATAHGGIFRMEVGTYTGDGNDAGQTITLTDTGLTPKRIEIDDLTATLLMTRTTSMPNSQCNVAAFGTWNPAIGTETAGSFKVGGDSNDYCNINGRVYYYTVWG